jgi:hypothetical protein
MAKTSPTLAGFLVNPHTHDCDGSSKGRIGCVRDGTGLEIRLLVGIDQDDKLLMGHQRMLLEAFDAAVPQDMQHVHVRALDDSGPGQTATASAQRTPYQCFCPLQYYWYLVFCVQFVSQQVTYVL